MKNTDEYYTNRTKNSDNLFFQVGKTVDGQPISQKQLSIISRRIINALQLKKDEAVADLGCGNGLITREIATHSMNTIGVEKNENLARIFREKNPSIKIIEIDILNADYKKLKPNKFFLYEVAQHLTKENLKALIYKIDKEKNHKFEIFIGGVPEKGKEHYFYNNNERRISRDIYLKTNGTDPLGNWHSSDDIAKVAETLGLYYQHLPQPDNLYTSHYRFDCILRGSK